jgi:hypothetical protein
MEQVLYGMSTASTKQCASSPHGIQANYGHVALHFLGTDQLIVRLMGTPLMDKRPGGQLSVSGLSHEAPEAMHAPRMASNMSGRRRPVASSLLLRNTLAHWLTNRSHGGAQKVADSFVEQIALAYFHIKDARVVYSITAHLAILHACCAIEVNDANLYM